MFQSVHWKQYCSVEVASSGQIVMSFWTGLVSFRSGLYAGISITEMWSKYPRWGGVQPCTHSFLLCKQSPVCCFPLLQSSHVGRSLAKLSLSCMVEVTGYDEKAVGVICLLFTDGAVQFMKRVLSVCTRGNVNHDNNNVHELPQQIERSTLHKHKLHQWWTCFVTTTALLHHSLLIYTHKPPPRVLTR